MGLIVNSVHRNMMGSANGLGQSLVALLRAIGPITCGPAFAWSLAAGLPYVVSLIQTPRTLTRLLAL